jgi:hypothetical protein
MWVFESLKFKYKLIFKFKINREKIINDWDVKMENNWEKNIREFILKKYAPLD